METKKCLQCGNEFESKVAPGVEQKYCSKQCRMKAGNNRRFETIKKRQRYLKDKENVYINIESFTIYA